MIRITIRSFIIVRRFKFIKSKLLACCSLLGRWNLEERDTPQKHMRNSNKTFSSQSWNHGIKNTKTHLEKQKHNKRIETPITQNKRINKQNRKKWFFSPFLEVVLVLLGVFLPCCLVNSLSRNECVCIATRFVYVPTYYYIVYLLLIQFS